ncbi:MAG: glycosyltransferase [Marinibacterium sp.]
MFRRVLGLYGRYARQHRHIEGPGFSFGAPVGADSEGKALTGHIDRVAVSGDKITFTGWTTAEKITLIGSEGRAAARPTLMRTDVAEAHGLPSRVGFEMTQPFGDGRFTLRAQKAGKSLDHHVAPISARALRRSRRALAVRFLATLMRAAPDAVRAMARDDLGARSRVKEIFGFRTRPEAAPMETRIFADPNDPLPAPDPVPVTIVLPVYNAFSLLPEVLARVVANTDLPWHLVVIEDCSTDPGVRPWLKDWVAAQEADTPGRITLLLNEENRGFIASVNRGFAVALERGDHVLLLNSDAFVPERWASRMLRPILSHQAVASVTPMSNDAEIFSVPVICARTVLDPGQGDAIDKLARSFNPEATLSVTPTGVGFCMAVNISYLKEFPEFDVTFGRGYGEEVDWCQKVRARGGRHLGLPGLFVEHRGGESFGSEEKLKLVMKNNAVIARRYPPYDAEVQDFIAADPLITGRVALAVAWAASRPGEADEETGFPVYLAHALGGGAEMYLDRRIAQDLARGRPSVVIRVGGPVRWQVEVVSGAGRVAGMTDDWAFVARLLAPLTRRHIVYNCAVGDPDPAAIPEYLLDLKGAGDTLEILFHDFFPLSPSYTLLDEDGRYRGSGAGKRGDKAHTILRPGGDLVTLEGWRAAWGDLMTAADRAVVFSNDSYAHVARVYPGCADKLVLRPHDMLARVPRLTPPKGKGRVVAVLGNIGYQKGAAVVAELGRMLSADPSMDLVVIGNVDPAYMPPDSVPVHGDYTLEELPDLVERYGITDWLIPSIWPETFSFTTHEALATGLPVYAFYVGAQGEAVARAENGHTIHFDAESPLALHALNTLRGETGLEDRADRGHDGSMDGSKDRARSRPGTKTGMDSATAFKTGPGKDPADGSSDTAGSAEVK